MTPGKALGKRCKVGQEPRRSLPRRITGGGDTFFLVSSAAADLPPYLVPHTPRLHQGLQAYQPRNPAGQAPSGLNKMRILPRKIA